jgi:hypothetical protein
MTVTIFKNILETKTPHYLPIDKIIDRIGNGKSKELCEKIRNCTDKAQRTELKKQLPSICFSGKFSKRANDSCLEHSGLVCLDFDHVEDLLEFKNIICKDKFVMLAFISPSGDGLKVVIKIPTSIENHSASCRALKDYFKDYPLDNFEDVARVCFESYDNEIYINFQSEIFTDLIHEKIIEKKVIEKTIDSNEIFEKLKVWIEKYEHYTDGNKHKFLVKFAGACNRFGLDKDNTANLLIFTYQNAASYVKAQDIEKIVNTIYQKYSFQYATAFFETTGIAFEKYTTNRMNDNFFHEYNDENKTDLKTLLFSKYKLDWDKEYHSPDFVIFICEGSKWYKIGSLGNFSCLTGKSKSRKSYAKHFFEASALRNGRLNEKFMVKLPTEKRNIIEIDTEQGVNNVFNSAYRMVKMANIPDIKHYSVFALREMGYKQRCEAIEIIIQENPTLGILFLDGVADLAFGNNDENEANRVVQMLMYLTAKYNIHIMTVIHQPKGSDWATGHLGSAIEKKAESVINIHKENSYSVFEAKQLRNCDDFAPFPFLINSDGIPELINDQTIINEIIDSDI